MNDEGRVEIGSRRGPLAERCWQWRLMLAGRRLRESGCGACGYPVKGLAGTTCPECGADQRDVGVSDPLGPPPWWVRAVAWSAVWAALVLAGAWCLNPVLLEGVPRGMSNHRDYILNPKSFLYSQVHVRRIGYGYGSPWFSSGTKAPQRGWIGMSAVVPGVASEFEFEVTRGTYSYGSPMVRPASGKLDVAAILGWLKLMGVDTRDATVQADAAELLKLITTPDFDSHPEYGLRQFFVAPTRGQPEWEPASKGQWTLNATWVLAITLGGLLIARWHYRRPAVRGFSLDAPARA